MKSVATRLSLLGHLTLILFAYGCQDPATASFEETIPDIAGGDPDRYSLTTNVTPDGAGTITPANGEYPEGSKIEIEAIAAEGWFFSGWEGDLTGTRNPDSLTVDGDKVVTARFVFSEYELNIEIEGEGRVITEQLESEPTEDDQENLAAVQSRRAVSGETLPGELKAGLDEEPETQRIDQAIGRDKTSISQEHTISQIRTVRLTAEPSEGWEFVRWEGDLEGDENPETLVLDEDKTVTAVFEPLDGNSSIRLTRQPGRTIAGSAITPAPEIEITNIQENPEEGIEVTVREQNDYSFDDGRLAVETGSDGRAEFDDLVINRAGTYVLVFTADEIGQVSSNSFEVSSAEGDPDRTTATVPDGVAGEPTEISIIVEDEFGNRVSGVADQLAVRVSGANKDATVDPVSDDGNGSYSTAYTPTNAGEDKIRIELNGKNIDDSPFTSAVEVSDATNLLIIEQPGDTEAGQPLAGPPAVRITDELVNPVEGVDVRVSEQDGYKFDDGTLTVVTDSDGRAVFNDLAINRSGDYRLVFHVEEAGQALSEGFEVVTAEGSPSQTTATVPDGIVEERTPVTIIVEDPYGNRVRGADKELSISVSGANSGADFESVSEDGDGVYATGYTPAHSGEDRLSIRLNGVHISGSPYSSNITDSDDEDEDDNDNEGDNGNNIIIEVQPGDTKTGRPVTGPPTIRVMGNKDKPLGGIEVSVSELGGYSFDSGTLVRTTKNNGRVAFDDLIISREGRYTLVFEAEGVNDPVISETFEVENGNDEEEDEDDRDDDDDDDDEDDEEDDDND